MRGEPRISHPPIKIYAETATQQTLALLGDLVIASPDKLDETEAVAKEISHKC